MYIANINIRSGKKLYKKGDILGKEFPEKDILRLTEMGAVFSRGETPSFDAYDNEAVFLGEGELRKKTKGELTEYGKSIGFDVSEELTKEEMISSLLNYIEETEDNDESG